MADVTLSQCFEAALFKLIASQTGRRIPSADPELKLDDLGFDEVDRALVALILEEDFGVSVPEGREYDWKTLGDVFAMLSDNIGTRQGAGGTVDLVTFPTLLGGTVTETAAQAYDAAVDLAATAIKPGADVAEGAHDALTRFEALSKAGKLGIVK